MITRKRGRPCKSNPNVDVHTTSAPEEIRDLGNIPSDTQATSEELSSESMDATALELDDLFAIDDDFAWTLEKSELDPIFDIDLPDLSLGNTTDQDSGVDVRSSRIGNTIRRSQDHFSRNINKNAIAARMNRLKKKEYVSGLEKKVGSLSSENRSLKQENDQLNKRVEELEDETRYLRAVLANESMLAQLLSRLSGVNGMKLSTSLFQVANEYEHDYAMPRKRVKVEEKETSGGVCLHVDKNHVSVEFCTKCAESASTSLKM